VTIGWGHPAHVFAATEPGLVSTDPAAWQKRYAERGVDSDSFDPVWFEGATDWLDADKVERRASQLNEIAPAAISTDLHPTIYLQRLLLWDRMTGGRSGQLIERIRSFDWHRLVIGMVVVAALSLLVYRIRGNWTGGVVTVSVATTGFATMALAIIWLFAFQNLYGYVYQRIGWIIAIFMGGLVVGCAVTASRSKKVTSGLPPYLWKRLVLVDVLLAVLAFTAPVVLPVLSTMQATPTSFVFVEMAVWIMVAATGALGGAAFALAGGLELGRTGRAGRAAAGIVGADHAGACLGALLTGILMVPVYGTATTALILGGMKLVSAILLGSGFAFLHSRVST
jgi:spermidine synthase